MVTKVASPVNYLVCKDLLVNDSPAGVVILKLPPVFCVMSTVSVRAMRGSEQCATPTTRKDHQNEAVEPPTKAIITIFYGVVVIGCL